MVRIEAYKAHNYSQNEWYDCSAHYTVDGASRLVVFTVPYRLNEKKITEQQKVPFSVPFQVVFIGVTHAFGREFDALNCIAITKSVRRHFDLLVL